MSKNPLSKRSLGLLFIAIVALLYNYFTSNGTNFSIDPTILGTQVTSAPTPMVTISIVPSTVLKPVQNTTQARIVRVVDGDTVVVTANGAESKVRLIGINSPESVDPRREVECYGKEASAYAKQILGTRSVSLEADASQDDVDKYGRILRYIFLEDGTNFNKQMISEGYAYEYTYDLPYKYQNEFKSAQQSAQDAKKGLWGEGTCKGVK